MVTTCFSSNIITQFLRHSGLIIEHWLTELICVGQENIWLSVMTHGPHYSCFPQSKLHDLKPNTSASRPTTQSISTFIIWDIRPRPYSYWKNIGQKSWLPVISYSHLFHTQWICNKLGLIILCQFCHAFHVKSVESIVIKQLNTQQNFNCILLAWLFFIVTECWKR